MNPEAQMMPNEMGIQPLKFTQVDSYTTFRVEYAVDGDALVFHFFRPLVEKKDDHYWLDIFPRAMDPVARGHFKAEAPRLRAAFTEELDSWWLRANGYGHILDTGAYVQKFFEKLDQVLDTMAST